MWFYLLKNNIEAFDALKKFRALVEKIPERKIEALRTDRGGEFLSMKFIQYCQEAGISRQYTASYSPQQNGVVERRNHTMVEMAQCLLQETGLPKYIWGKAILHAIYLLNRFPTRAVTGSMPYETWGGKKPNLRHIRVFGCLAYMKVPTVNLKKLDHRSKPVVYIGKEPDTKAYRLYDPISKSISVSRDVVFAEKETWDWSDEAEDQATHSNNFVMMNNTAKRNGDLPEQDEFQTHVPNSQGNRESEAEVESSNVGESTMSEVNSGEDSQPMRYRPMSEVYNEIEPIELVE